MARRLGLTFDTGALIALERRRQRMADVFRRATQRGLTITVPASVVAEWWRGQRGRLVHDILASVDVEKLTEEVARAAGEALAATGRSNSVDAVVVASAATRGDIVYTSDLEDLERLAAHFRAVRVLGV
jgi:predicted nucleic acid-binding protein